MRGWRTTRSYLARSIPTENPRIAGLRPMWITARVQPPKLPAYDEPQEVHEGREGHEAQGIEGQKPEQATALSGDVAQ
jgi:hypothetical protein